MDNPRKRKPAKKAGKKKTSKGTNCTVRDVAEMLQFLQMIVHTKVKPSDLPVGKLPSKEINEQCDEWFRRICTLNRRDAFEVPPELAPWIAARLFPGSMMFGTLAKFGNTETHQPTAPEFVYEWCVKLWNAGASKQWMDFYHTPDKQLAYAGVKLTVPGAAEVPDRSWKQKLDDQSAEYNVSQFFMIDEAAIARKEGGLPSTVFELLLTKVFLPALKQFKTEMEKRGKGCQLDTREGAIKLAVTDGEDLEVQVGFSAVRGQLDQAILTEVVSGIFRFDTKGGKIKTDDVLNHLAELYMAIRPRD